MNVTKLLRWCFSGYMCFCLHQAAQAGVKINEVLAANSTAYEDESLASPDWLELYNDGATSVNLSGYSLSKSALTPRQWVFPEGSSIPAGGYLVIFCDASSVIGPRNTGYNLSAEGDALYLYDASRTLLDSIVFGMQVADRSIGRLSSLSGAWGLALPTYGAANSAAPLGIATALKINEWLAGPITGNDWFEIYNPQTNPVALGGLYLTDSLTRPTQFKIPSLSFIGGGPDGFLVMKADNSSITGPSHTNFKLPKSGGLIAIIEANKVIDQIVYGVQSDGVSQGRLPDGGTQLVNFPTSSSPGASNFLPLSSLTVNEVLTHTDPPLEDAIEIYNAGNSSASIGGWYLSDSQQNFKKYQFPANTVIPAKSYLVIYEHDYDSTNSLAAFDLNSSQGDAVYLSAADANGSLTGYRSEVKFGASPNGVSLGRYTNSIGSIFFPLQKSVTLGSANNGPLASSIVISEIMYHPVETSVGVDNTQDEFIEIANISTSSKPLYHPLQVTNTWHIRGGVGFDFPQGVVLSPRSALLVVSFNPQTDATALTQFRSRYALSPQVPIYGPYSGKLGNAGDSVRLEQPDDIQELGHINQGDIPYLDVDEVDYLDTGLWPASADGSGSSLHRIDLSRFANDVVNWQAASPTPGLVPSSTSDTDNDGMPNDWESLYSFNSNDASDANRDFDNDGMTNLQEYLAGTDPKNNQSSLKISAQRSGSSLILKFQGVSGKTYVVQRQSIFGTGSWTKQTEVTAGNSNQAIEVIIDSTTSGANYYRLIIP